MSNSTHHADPLERLVAALAAHDCDPRERGADSYESRCPAHDGSRHNLSVDRGDDNRVLIHCHHAPGCEVRDIVRAIGLTMADLAPPGNGDRPGRGRQRQRGADHRKAHTSSDRKEKAKPKFPSLDAAVAWLDRKTNATSHKVYSYSTTFKVIRVNYGDGQKTYRPVHQADDGWSMTDPPGKLPLYNQPSLADAETVLLVEGEKCADALTAYGFTATTTAHGAESPHKTDLTPLAGKVVVILPDANVPGERYRDEIAGILLRLEPPAQVKCLPLAQIWQTEEPIPDGGDVADWLTLGTPNEWSREQCAEYLADAVQQAQPYTPPAKADGSARGGGGGRDAPGVDRGPGRQRGQRGGADGDDEAPAKRKLIEIGRGVELFHAPDKTAFARVQVHDHLEIYPVKGTAFKGWLCREFYKLWDDSPSSEALSSALNLLEARARFDGPKESVFVRVSDADADGLYHIDLADDDWRIIQIGPDGCKILEQAECVAFHRPDGVLPLPAPKPGGSLDDLRGLINIGCDQNWLLFLAWLLWSMRPGGPFVILLIQGEQGTAKSGLTSISRNLIDPNAVPLKGDKLRIDDLWIAAVQSWLLVVDNLTKLSDELSDAFCRLATGGGHAKRKNYTDDEQKFFFAKRPLLINGIVAPASRPDLLDRSILLTLPPIPDDKRRTEEEVMAMFAELAPGILGAVLDLLSKALKTLPSVQLERMTRMAGFCRFGEAVARALGMNAGAFMLAYDSNKQVLTDEALESCPTVEAIVVFMESRESWCGTSAELLRALHAADDGDGADAFTVSSPRSNRARVQNQLPENPKALSNELERQKPVLRRLKIDARKIEHRTNRGTPWILSRITDAAPAREKYGV